MPISDVHDKPGHLVRRCQQIAVALFLEHCAVFDLTPIQYAVLRAVDSEPGLDQITLAGLVALDRSTIGGVVDRLCRRDLVERRADETDRRVRRLVILPAGRALLRRAEPAVRRVQDALLAPLTPVQRDAFVAAMRAIAEAHNDSSRAPLRTLEPQEDAA